MIRKKKHGGYIAWDCLEECNCGWAFELLWCFQNISILQATPAPTPGALTLVSKNLRNSAQMFLYMFCIVHTCFCIYRLGAAQTATFTFLLEGFSPGICHATHWDVGEISFCTIMGLPASTHKFFLAWRLSKACEYGMKYMILAQKLHAMQISLSSSEQKRSLTSVYWLQPTAVQQDHKCSWGGV